MSRIDFIRHGALIYVACLCVIFEISLFVCLYVTICLQCFDAVGWPAGRATGLQKTRVMVYWHGYVSGAKCRLAYGPADATATHCLCSKIQICFTFLVPAHLGSPRKKGR